MGGRERPHRRERPGVLGDKDGEAGQGGSRGKQLSADREVTWHQPHILQTLQVRAQRTRTRSVCFVSIRFAVRWGTRLPPARGPSHPWTQHDRKGTLIIFKV